MADQHGIFLRLCHIRDTEEQVHGKGKGKGKAAVQDVRLSAGVQKLRDSLLGQMYLDQRFETVHFYHQDARSFPIGKVLFQGQPIALAKKNTFDAAHWQKQKKPGWYFGTWPPTCAEDIVGFVDDKHVCFSCKQQEVCECDYELWMDGMQLEMVKTVRLSEVGPGEYGCFARRDIDWYENLGEYTGELRPLKQGRKSLADTQYSAHIMMGPPRPKSVKSGGQAKCNVDATHRGSLFRWLNHSCNANARLSWGRVGMNRRVLVVEAMQPILEGMEITLDYGQEWFKGKHKCWCKSVFCKNPAQPRTTVQA